LRHDAAARHRLQRTGGPCRGLLLPQSRGLRDARKQQHLRQQLQQSDAGLRVSAVAALQGCHASLDKLGMRRSRTASLRDATKKRPHPESLRIYRAHDAKERCRSLARPSTGALRAPAQGEDKLLMVLRKILILSARASAQSKDAHQTIQRRSQFLLML